MKKNPVLLLLTVHLFFGFYLFGQSSPVHPSPEAMQFQKYGDYPVGNFTGVPDITIPIFTIKEGDLEVPVTISYHASGIKPDDIDGILGAGWVLNTGGIINQTVNGRRDESSFATSPMLTADYLSTFNNNSADYFSLRNNMMYYDWETDLFSFNFMGNNGRFILKNRSLDSCVLLDDKPLSVRGYRTGAYLDYFRMIDAKGTDYMFSQRLNHAIPSSGDNLTWMLSTVTSGVDSNNKIMYDYFSRSEPYREKPVDTYVKDDVQSSTVIYSSSCGDVFMQNYMPYYDGDLQWNYQANLDDIGLKTPTLITFRSGRMVLNYDPVNKRLTSIQVYNIANELVKNMEFYIVRRNSSIAQERYVLREIRYKDAKGTLLNKHHFKYYGDDEGDGETNMRISQECSRDYWGYYNGYLNRSGASNDNMIPNMNVVLYNYYGSYLKNVGSGNRQTDPDLMKIYTLHEIDHPTGGKTVFDFEANQYVGNGAIPGYTGKYVGGLRIHTIKNYTEDDHLAEVKEYEYPDGLMDVYPVKDYFMTSERHYINRYGYWESYRRIFVSSEPSINLAPHGSPVVYTSVTEITRDLINSHSYTKVFTYDYKPVEYTWPTCNGTPDDGGEGEYYIHYRPYLKDIRANNDGNLLSLTENNETEAVRYTDYEYEEIPLDTFNTCHLDQYAFWQADPCPYGPPDEYPEEFNFVHGQSAYPWNFWDYYIHTSRRRLVNTYKYDQGLGVSTYYDYNNDIHNQVTKQKVEKSTGEQQITEFKYPHDFAGTAPYSEMITRHIWSPVVETNDSIFSNNLTTPLKSTRTNYTKTWGNDIIAPATIEAKTGTGNYKTRWQAYGYDEHGNILTASKPLDAKTSYVWGYDKLYPIAKVVGAQSNEIFFDSFEEANTWDGVTRDSTMPHSGRYSGKIVKNDAGELVYHSLKTLQVALSAPVKFKYSGWIYSTGPSAELFLFMKTASETGYFTYVDSRQVTEINQWVYVEGEFTVPANITQLNLRIDNNGGGTVWFDDIRLHPSASVMTTWTYDPLVGMTSETDANNRSIFYEYDQAGRLSLVRDNNRNILKKYCYNYTGQPVDCGQIFRSTFIHYDYYSESCSVNYTADPYYVEVPEGAFTSLISQTDADVKAAQYAQSLANINGSCTLHNDTELSFYNSTGNNYWIIELYNTETSEYFYFDTNGSSEGVLGNIPSGNYTVSFNSGYSDPCYISFQCSSGGYVYTSRTFNNITLSPSCGFIDISTN